MQQVKYGLEGIVTLAAGNHPPALIGIVATSIAQAQSIQSLYLDYAWTDITEFGSFAADLVGLANVATFFPPTVSSSIAQSLLERLPD